MKKATKALQTLESDINFHFLELRSFCDEGRQLIDELYNSKLEGEDLEEVQRIERWLETFFAQHRLHEKEIPS